MKGNLNLGHYIFPLIIPISKVFYIILIVDSSPSQRGTAFKHREFMEWTTQENVWVAPNKNVPKWPVVVEFTLVLSLFSWYSPLLLGAFKTALPHSTKDKIRIRKRNMLAIHFSNFTLSFRDLSSVWRIDMQPQQLRTSSCWSSTWPLSAVGWHPIPQWGYVASQPTGFCRSL